MANSTQQAHKHTLYIRYLANTPCMRAILRKIQSVFGIWGAQELIHWNSVMWIVPWSAKCTYVCALELGFDAMKSKSL